MVAGVGSVRLQAPQPDLGQILEPAILVNLPGVQMAVIVYQRKIFRVVVKQVSGGFGFQQEILVHECFH